MKNLNAKYKYGHLWDKTTGKRIILKDNSEILIKALSSQSNLDLEQ
jgi:hypothetical protein